MTEWFIVKWLFALSPIAVVLVLMIFFDWSGSRAGAAAWLTALIVGIVFFGAHPELLAYSQMRAILHALNVLYIIWPALLLYNIVNETGAIKAIGVGIERLSGDKSIQLLIFGWIFSSFLQGVAGYGVPIAVVAPLLVGLGFSPVAAVAVPAIGHCWSVTFGSMAASFQAMMAVTGLSSQYLGGWAAILLGAAGKCVPLDLPGHVVGIVGDGLFPDVGRIIKIMHPGRVAVGIVAIGIGSTVEADGRRRMQGTIIIVVGVFNFHLRKAFRRPVVGLGNQPVQAVVIVRVGHPLVVGHGFNITGRGVGVGFVEQRV